MNRLLWNMHNISTTSTKSTSHIFESTHFPCCSPPFQQRHRDFGGLESHTFCLVKVHDSVTKTMLRCRLF